MMQSQCNANFKSYLLVEGRQNFSFLQK